MLTDFNWQCFLLRSFLENVPRELGQSLSKINKNFQSLQDFLIIFLRIMAGLLHKAIIMLPFLNNDCNKMIDDIRYVGNVI